MAFLPDVGDAIISLVATIAFQAAGPGTPLDTTPGGGVPVSKPTSSRWIFPSFRMAPRRARALDGEVELADDEMPSRPAGEKIRRQIRFVLKREIKARPYREAAKRRMSAFYRVINLLVGNKDNAANVLRCFGPV
jgi:hypothetical protein